jgi:hypothetical protein
MGDATRNQNAPLLLCKPYRNCRAGSLLPLARADEEIEWRRTLIAALGGTAAAWPPLVHAQRPARLAWIAPGTEAITAKFIAALRESVANNGLAEGRDYVLGIYYADGDYRRFPALTQEALAHAPAVLLVVTIASVRAAQQATRTIPIVAMSTNDPVGAGLIDSLARPGGNWRRHHGRRCSAQAGRPGARGATRREAPGGADQSAVRHQSADLRTRPVGWGHRGAGGPGDRGERRPRRGLRPARSPTRFSSWPMPCSPSSPVESRRWESSAGSPFWVPVETLPRPERCSVTAPHTPNSFDAPPST